MPLSDKQLAELYKKTIENHRDIHWIREDLERGGIKFKEQDIKISKIAGEQAFIKGKLGAFVLFLTLCATIMVHGIAWLVSHLLGYKWGV